MGVFPNVESHVLQDVGPNQDVSILVEGSGEIVAERPMYFKYKEDLPDYGWTGGHDVMGYTL